ncbi:tyrosine-type recombinase/integrase [Streptomyces cinerochromogenes]|uniref:Tyrosine-type recombinase/integrase n=1 Tax=Streptomyces cinerochromogenes TaxID=66422 RepID=A0ABW7B635_9ACTN
MAESDAPFDRWHKKYPKPGDKPCKCGTRKNPLYPSADHGRGQAALQKRKQRGYVPPPDEGLIVTTRTGRPLSRSHFNDKWRAAVELAGLPEGTRFHDLKHFYTSRLGADGRYDPKTVQALSRHAEFSETWDTYAHPPVAVQGVKVDTFSGLFGAGGPGITQAQLGTQQRADGVGRAAA